MTLTLAPTFTPALLGTAQIGEQSGELAVGGGQVWTYKGRIGEIVTIRVEADVPAQLNENEARNEAGLDTLFILYAPDGEFLVEADDIESGINTNSPLTNFVLPQDGLYQIEVRSWGNLSGGAYTLIIESIGASPPTNTPTATPSS
jgi:hypothetical protein